MTEIIHIKLLAEGLVCFKCSVTLATSITMSMDNWNMNTECKASALLKKEFLKEHMWGTWGAQSFECPALDLGSGHDLTVHGMEPCVGHYTDSREPVWDSLSFSLKINK